MRRCLGGRSHWYRLLGPYALKYPRHVQVFRLVITPSLYQGLWYVHPSVTFFCLLTYCLPSLQAYDLVRTTLLITSLDKRCPRAGELDHAPSLVYTAGPISTAVPASSFQTFQLM